jgi:type II secretory pathway pseudopilin PulG
MNILRKNHKGLTLIALVITIIVLLILAGITIGSILNDSGIILNAEEVKKEAEIREIIDEVHDEILYKQEENITGEITDKELEEILEEYGTLSDEEDMLDKTLTTTEGDYEIAVADIWDEAQDSDEKIAGAVLKIGDYVKYNVTYTDMFTEYPFSATDGWRVLDPGTEVKGKYTGVKLISTGIPAMINLNINSIDSIEKDDLGTLGKWAGDSTDRNNYASTFYRSLYSNNDKVMYAASGLYYNFGKILFSYGTSSDEHNGYYKKVNNKTEGNLLEDEFIENGKAKEVHNLTLTELNKARGETENLSTWKNLSIDSGDTGLFYLAGLSDENENYGYTSSISCYYVLASPSSGGNIWIFVVSNYGPIAISNGGGSAERSTSCSYFKF